LLSRCGKFNNYIIYEIYVLISPNWKCGFCFFDGSHFVYFI